MLFDITHNINIISVGAGNRFRSAQARAYDERASC